MHFFQTAYFPSLAYVRAVAFCSNPQLDFHEHFVKQSIRTRCEILSSNGVLQLNVPIIHNSGIKQAVKEVQIDYTSSWLTDHWRAIESAYANAPHFEHYAHDLQHLFDQRPTYLIEFNQLIWDWIAASLGFQKEIELCTEFSGKVGTDKKEWLGRVEGITSPYTQVLAKKQEFTENLSVLDGLFNEGPLLRKHFLPLHS